MTWQNPRSAISSACVAWIGYLTTLAVNICRSSCRVTVPRHKASKSMSKPTFAEAVHDAATKLKLPISLWLALLQGDTLCHHRQRELGSKRQAREEEPNKHISRNPEKSEKGPSCSRPCTHQRMLLELEKYTIPHRKDMQNMPRAKICL